MRLARDFWQKLEIEAEPDGVYVRMLHEETVVVALATS